MIQLRKKDDRGVTKISWLDSRHSFSFGEYYDRAHMGFGPLRVINEDIVAPSSGFDTHGHADMEIMTYVLQGSLEHKDSLGNGGLISPGDVQLMSAGKGILHSEFNPSNDEAVHLLQIWIMPDEKGTRPGYQQTSFDPKEIHNSLRLVVSKDGAEGSLKIRQDAKVWVTRLDAGKTASLPLRADKLYWFQTALGKADVRGQALAAGDALGLDHETGDAKIHAAEDSELVVFELPA